MRVLIVTAADEKFADLLRGLVESLLKWQPRPYAALACFDLGLAAATRDWVTQHSAHVIKPDWDLPVDESVRREQTHLRALTVRPFLPRYFPGYDIYLWIDADAWVQDRSAIESYVHAAADGAMAIVAQDHPAYHHSAGVLNWRSSRASAYFGADAGAFTQGSKYWNAGVFALAAEAPHWQRWAAFFADGLAATAGRLCCDQTALNQVIRVEQLPVRALPARYNWLCHLALPWFDVTHHCFCDPLERQTRIGILHLTNTTKNLRLSLGGDQSGRTQSLRYPSGGFTS